MDRVGEKEPAGIGRFRRPGPRNVSRARVLIFILGALAASRVAMHLPLPHPVYRFELYDLGHRLISPLAEVFPLSVAGWIWWVGAISLALFFTATLAAILLRGIGCRLGLALAISALLHSLCWHATILPVPQDLLWRFPLFTGESAQPNDFWFSGHVALAMLFALAASRQAWPIRVLAWIYVALITLLVLSARAHYSIDVLGALFVAYAVYNLSGSLLHTRIFAPGRARQPASSAGP